MKPVAYGELIRKYGEDILTSEGMKLEQKLIQHGNCSVYHHSVAVASMCLKIADKCHLKVRRRALVRGALLHDYFLYDWHEPLPRNHIHGFTHPYTALKNAERDFSLGKIEKNMIKRHMFPLTPIIPRYREGMILCVADKICAVQEVFLGIGQKKHRQHPLNKQYRRNVKAVKGKPETAAAMKRRRK